MIKFSKEKVLLLHRLLAEETGGSIGIRDEGLLDSAMETAFSGFGGQEFYPTKEEKGACLGYHLISNHAFVDGNKRIGMYVMLMHQRGSGCCRPCHRFRRYGLRRPFVLGPGAPHINNTRQRIRDGIRCFLFLFHSLQIKTPRAEASALLFTVKKLWEKIKRK